MTKYPMKLYFEELYQTTGDLLKRVKTYDRNNLNLEEINQMYFTHCGIEFTKSIHSANRIWMERAIVNLEYMKSRLLTIMEDLLYTA
jgi:hypothetical protein